jgi:hypothetical protein
MSAYKEDYRLKKLKSHHRLALCVCALYYFEKFDRVNLKRKKIRVTNENPNARQLRRIKDNKEKKSFAKILTCPSPF